MSKMVGILPTIFYFIFLKCIEISMPKWYHIKVSMKITLNFQSQKRKEMNMSKTVQNAAKGQKKSMVSLYESHKNKLYAFCNVMLNDKQKAGNVASATMNEVWAKLSANAITEEKQFSQLLVVMAAKKCRSLLFPKNNTFKLAEATSVPSVEIQGVLYTGLVEKGMGVLQEALSKMDPHLRYLYLLHTAGGLSFKQIGLVLKQKEGSVKTYYAMAVDILRNKLDQENKGVSVENAQSLVEQSIATGIFPEVLNESCLEQINENAKSQLPSLKVLIPAICGVLCLGLILAVVFTPLKNVIFKSTETSSTQEGLYTPPALEKDLTYYADIAIEKYGTITVQLDQISAPISAANFVKLANDGFYNGLTFHRIIEGFMMQGGDPNGDGSGGSANNIVGEFSANGYQNNILHKRGVISMARSQDNNSASSQFFIMHQDATHLDGQYAAFGYVTQGLDIVDTICTTAQPMDGNGTIAKSQQPKITSVTIRTEKGAPTNSTGGNDSGSSVTETVYTPPALEESLTYYADIAIQDHGTVTVELNQSLAPVSAANFVKLANDGFYNGLTFHRIMEGFMMQGGDPNGDGTGGSANTIVGEFSDNGHNNTLSHVRGVISMARSSAYNSASSQFFIVHQDSTFLDGQYAAFGHVTQGMDIVDTICTTAKPTDDNGTIPKEEQPIITSVTIRTE